MRELAGIDAAKVCINLACSHAQHDFFVTLSDLKPAPERKGLLHDYLEDRRAVKAYKALVDSQLQEESAANEVLMVAVSGEDPEIIAAAKTRVEVAKKWGLDLAAVAATRNAEIAKTGE